jgi:hypothetical protein
LFLIFSFYEADSETDERETGGGIRTVKRADVRTVTVVKSVDNGTTVGGYYRHSNTDKTPACQLLSCSRLSKHRVTCHKNTNHPVLLHAATDCISHQ